VGEAIPEGSVKIGLARQVAPRVFEETQEIRVYYSLETPGTMWSVAG
jgi:hypothetical protein